MMNSDFERIVLERLSKLDTMEEKLSKIDTMEEKLAKIDTMEEKLAKIDTMEEKLAKIDTMEEKLAKIDTMGEKLTKLDTMEERFAVIEADMKAVKKTALKVETDLIPKTQLMLDNYMNIAQKVNISSDLQEEVKTLRYEVDLIKQILSVNN